MNDSVTVYDAACGWWGWMLAVSVIAWVIDRRLDAQSRVRAEAHAEWMYNHDRDHALRMAGLTLEYLGKVYHLYATTGGPQIGPSGLGREV